MNKKTLEATIKGAYEKYMHAAFEKVNLYHEGKITKEEFEKELEALIHECSEELANR